MRLEGDHHAALAGQRPGGLEVAGDLVGVVGVAVVDADAGGLALELHPPAGAGERLQAAAQLVEAEPEPEAGGQRGQRVEDVVAAGDLQGHLAEPAAAVDHGERRGGAGELRSLGAQVGAARDSPTPTTLEAPARAPARRGRPRRRRRRTRRGSPAGSIRSRKVVEGRAVGLLGAVVVEVVGLDVGDQRARTASRRGTRRRSRRPRRRRARRCRRGRWSPVSLSSPPIAKDGSAPQCCSATVSSEVVVVLPWVPATATTRRPCITDSSAAERGSSRSPRRRASTTSGLSSRTAVETTSVSASRDVGGVVADVARWRRARAAPRGPGLLGVAAADRRCRGPA